MLLHWARDENDIRYRSTRSSKADASGKFKFSGLGPGDHELLVYAWRGEIVKKTMRRVINVGVDSAAVSIVFGY
ncbi:MAG: hypothetical protein ACI87H_003392 [Gammaproteobacteria bacterium]